MENSSNSAVSGSEPFDVFLWANEIDDPKKPDTYSEPFVK